MKFEVPTETTVMNALVFGPPGSGKTYSLPTMSGKGVIANAEGGLMGIRDKLGDRVKSVKIETYADLKSLAAELKTTDHGFEWVAIDSLTEVQKLLMDEIMASQTDKDIPAMRDWQMCIEELRRMIRFFRDLPINFIATALPKDDKDEQYGTITRKPLLPGKLADEACGYVDLVLYVLTKDEEGETKRAFLTQPSERYYAKDRSGKLEHFEKPDLGFIYKKIFGQKAEKGAAK